MHRSSSTVFGRKRRASALRATLGSVLRRAAVSAEAPVSCEEDTSGGLGLTTGRVLATEATAAPGVTDGAAAVVQAGR